MPLAVANRSASGIAHFICIRKLDPEIMELAGCEFVYSLAHIYIGALLLEFSLKTQNDLDIFLAQNWITTRDMCPVCSDKNMYQILKDTNNSKDMVFEGYHQHDTFIP